MLSWLWRKLPNAPEASRGAKSEDPTKLLAAGVGLKASLGSGLRWFVAHARKTKKPADH
jgi:hypothetical protein